VEHTGGRENDVTIVGLVRNGRHRARDERRGHLVADRPVGTRA
jgi:hypothetical protein